MTTLNLDDSVYITKKSVTLNEYHPDIAVQASAGSTAITLSSAANFSVGDYAYLSETYGAIGEIVKITGISGNIVYLKSGLAKTYSTAYDVYKADFSFTSSGDVTKIHSTSVDWQLKKEYTFREKTIGKDNWGIKDPTPIASDRLKHKETYTIKGVLLTDSVYTASAKQTFLRNICLAGGTVWLYENFGSDKTECMIDNVKITKVEGPARLSDATVVERYKYEITLDLTKAEEK